MQANSGNIILIGMPGSGKSTCGVVAAKLLLKNFFDTDLLIQNREGQRLQQIIDEKGLDYFARAEEEAVLSLDIAGTVIATGGSAVYSDRAMQHLKAGGKCVYLKVAADEIERRLANFSDRGVVIADGMTLADLYAERKPLYEKYADITVSAEGEIVSKDYTATKRELGDDYNMVKYGNAIAEWDAQAKAFADYTVGKTADEVMGLDTTTNAEGYQVSTDETLLASCTMAIDGMQAAIATAVNNAR